jgi:hypothetical protein
MNAVLPLVRRLWARIGSIFGRLAAFRFGHKGASLQGAWVDDFPSKLQRNKFYIAGERPNAWGAAMVCPCGCGEVIELNLLKQTRPSWSVHEHPDKTISVTPSVWRQMGCRSHFVLRCGRIEWC